MDRTYICIDLKSFYASVECVERGLNPLTTHLVVADQSRTEKTICLAVSPSLKEYGIPGRARLFEINQKIKQINKQRLANATSIGFNGESYDSIELTKDKNKALKMIIAPPQMQKYIEVSTKIYNIYLSFVSSEDIHVYSIDEVFIDITSYLNPLKISAYEFTKNIIYKVYQETGITATAGIANNLYLAKVAMDIVAKHQKADDKGVRIATLDEISYRKTLWEYKPLTDFWRIGKGIQNRLHKLGLYTMGDIALCSIGSVNSKYNEDLLYKEFGINAELLIDHAWGWEPTTIAAIKSYRPSVNSLSVGQVLHEAYDYDKARVIVKEMIDSLSLDMVEKKVVTNQLGLYIGYDRENIDNSKILENYKGEIVFDMYGRMVPKSAHGSINLDIFTSSTKKLTDSILTLFDEIVNKDLSIRRINISANRVILEQNIPQEENYIQLDMFNDYKTSKFYESIEKSELEKEKRTQQSIIKIKKKYGKNAILKGMNFEEGATMKERNNQIGGHKA